MEFLGKIAHQSLKEGDGCVLLATGKITEFTKQGLFPHGIRTVSLVDWSAKHYRGNVDELDDIDWKKFFSYFDRHVEFGFNYESATATVSQIYQCMDNFLKKERPDVVINQPPCNIFTEVMYALCKKYQIPYLGFIGSKFQGCVDIYDKEGTFFAYEETYEELKKTGVTHTQRMFVSKFLDNFISHKQLLPYQEHHFIPLNIWRRAFRFLKNQYQDFWPLLRYLGVRKKFRALDSESEIILDHTMRYPFSAFIRRFKMNYQHKKFQRVNESDKYFLFPLHLQPESSTSVLATYFCDQINTVRNIAFALPFPYKLYVKEHPSAVGHKPRAFYKKLQQIPQVVLVGPDENVERLTKYSQGVVTLTSTIGMEAALKGKRVYVLGDVFYTYHPLCQKVSGFEELRLKIKDDLHRPIEYTSKELIDINERFIISYYRNCIPGHVDDASALRDHNDYARIIESIRSIVQSTKKNV